ncbi:hypothetical protein HNP24_000223 [Chryseobacterium sediminis]|uniref:Uncharacterized protein n=1 Tax=Chryseobacterium sediminis TaxID=1679494 RepID=A0ABR6PUA1_9FLAO|nr:hypothetical protein [Chryseobacterium sediminis]
MIKKKNIKIDLADIYTTYSFTKILILWSVKTK